LSVQIEYVRDELKLVPQANSVKSGIRALIPFTDGFIVDHFARLGYVVKFADLVLTTEAVEEFAGARLEGWHRPGTVVRYELPGLLVVESAQPHPRQPTRDIVVVFLGHARVVMGVLDRSRFRFAWSM
jgi:hypothetical protein